MTTLDDLAAAAEKAEWKSVRVKSADLLRLVAVARAAQALPDLSLADKGFGPTASKRDLDAYFRGRKRLRAALAALEE